MNEETYTLSYLLEHTEGEPADLITHTGLSYEQAKDYRRDFQIGDFGCTCYNFKINKEQ